MKRTLLTLSLAVLTFAAFTPRVAAQETKKARGTVTAMTGTSLTVQVAGTAMDFGVDGKTVVEARGAGTAAKKAAADRKAGPSLAEVIKVGQPVEVAYSDAGGKMHATSIRAVASADAPTPSAAKSATGKVASVSASALTINGSGGGGATFTQTFVLSSKTKVIGKGAGTMAASSGGKVAATDLVHAGDTVHVEFSDVNGALQASAVTVTMKAAAAK